MAFDPAKPVEGSPIDAAELRNQFNALQAQITILQSQVTALQTAIGGTARNPTMGEFDPGFSDPPTAADLMKIQGAINDLLAELMR